MTLATFCYTYIVISAPWVATSSRVVGAGSHSSSLSPARHRAEHKPLTRPCLLHD